MLRRKRQGVEPAEMTTAPEPTAGHAHHPPAHELLQRPGALLTRSHLRELGLGRRAIDAVFGTLPVIYLPGYSYPMIRVSDYLRFLEEHTYDGTRVTPPRRKP